MSLSRLAVPILSLALVLPAGALAAQSPPAPEPPSIVPDLLGDLEQVREKVVGLAEAIPEEDWDWRPGEGVRSVREVFLHVAADNYLLTVGAESPIPESTGIRPDDYETLRAYEARETTKDETIRELEASFARMAAALEGTDAGELDDPVQMFGRDFTRQNLWLLAITHVHEHLGQMIAYARANEVVPPWSR